ncbi:thiopeptide-type bacteriocin biosynthesis protein [Streptomyces mayonensis]|uniref:thiopeptide-type bacteriocin biosynthesis protein n=1 Tax=Streptomyces mayonensis TaxID=2750816 RepID=UPI0027E4A583|nr:thiopeptide-type bacteriocin biosynthesis protein [Streptomyces sp. A108]
MRPVHRIEDSVLAVLGGAPLQDSARHAGVTAAFLRSAIDRYRAAGRAALDIEPTRWQQAEIRFADYPTAHRSFRSHLLPALQAGPVASWWFVRKNPHWRLRFHTADGATAEDAVACVTDALDSSRSWGVTTGWRYTPYEPEAIAFGGPEGMDLAHALFHTDSVGVLDYLHTEPDSRKGWDAKAVSLMGMALMLRAARLEWGEQGDVWGRVEQHRPLPDDVDPEQVNAMTAPMRRLLLTDARPLIESGSLVFVQPWFEGLEGRGRALANATVNGTLKIGKRAVLARHVLFHWNRMGFTLRQQAIWARAAREAVLGR